MTPAEIRSLRKRMGLSVDDFAAACGFTSKNRKISVYRWESGKRGPSPTALKVLNDLAAKKTKGGA